MIFPPQKASCSTSGTGKECINLGESVDEYDSPSIRHVNFIHLRKDIRSAFIQRRDFREIQKQGISNTGRMIEKKVLYIT